MGIILFLRMGWGVSQAGVLGSLLIIAVAEIMAILTVLSFSAIVTNGEMEGGGSYYMISRSLGPEFGGAMGMLFYVAYAMGVCFYIIGFATEVQTTWYPDLNSTASYWCRIGVGSLGLLFVLSISAIGADAFAKFNVWFFVVQFGAIIVGMLSYTFIQSETDLSTQYYADGSCEFYCDATTLNTYDENGLHYCTTATLNSCLNGTLYNTTVTGWDVNNLKENLWWNFTDTESGSTQDVNSMCNTNKCSWTLVFAVLFPMATGIMEGANLSGDLKDPAKSIPIGTIAAVGSAIVIYCTLVVTMGASFPRSTLQTNMNAMQEACISKYVVVVGILISSISSALGSLFGGSRVLQALARDNLFPCLKYFAKGTDKGDEPRRGVFFTWFVAQCCLFLGGLDNIAPLITSFFCMSYALCNLTAFALSVTGAPNFRPTWKYYSWQLSLLGFAINIVVMFFLDLKMSIVSLVLLLALFVFVWWRHPATDWGDISQALMYHQVRKYLLKIDETKTTHTKFWRPSTLLFVDDYSATQIKGMVNFCREIKKGGLMVLGNVIVGDVGDFAKKEVNQKIRDGWSKYITDRGIKAFPQEVIAPTVRLGYQFLMQGSGLGGLRCNTVVMPLFRPSLMNGSGSSKTGDNRLDRGISFYNDVADALGSGTNASTNRDIKLIQEAAAAAAASATATATASNQQSRQSMYGLRRDGTVNERLMNQNSNLPVRNSTEYLNVIEDALSLRLNVIIGCNTDRTYDSLWREKKGPTTATHNNQIFTKDSKATIDVWIFGEWTGSFDNSDALSIQLGSILHQRKQWKNVSTLRVMCIPDASAKIKAPPKTPKKRTEVEEEEVDEKINGEFKDDDSSAVEMKVQKKCHYCGTSLAGITRKEGKGMSFHWATMITT
jgi:potassium/chloride transporter 9